MRDLAVITCLLLLPFLSPHVAEAKSKSLSGKYCDPKNLRPIPDGDDCTR